MTLRRTGLREVSLGLFYEDRARRGAPLVLTFDALFALAHVAFASAEAEVEARIERVDLSAFLHRLDARLTTEAKGARPDLADGYQLARSVVAVALALTDSAYVVPPDLRDGVGAEMSLIRAHAGFAESPLFGQTLDYGAMAPRGPIERSDDMRTPVFQAAAWLAEAPFSFLGRGETPSARVDVGAARAQTRAALVLARLLQRRDPNAAAAFEQMTLLDRFVLGEGAALSPLDVAEVARQAGLDLRGGNDMGDTTKVDHFRHLAAQRSMRLVPLRASPEGQVLEKLVRPSGAHAGPSDSRMPNTEDVVTWLGTLTPKNADHGSCYGSFVEILASGVRPHLEKTGEPASGAQRDQMRRSALAAWTLLRHDALAFSHDALEPRPSQGAGSHAPTSLPGHAPLVFVSPPPEVIANLLGTIRQIHTGLVDLGGIERTGSSSMILAEVESIFGLALEGAKKQSDLGGEPEAVPVETALGGVLPRIAALEAWIGPAANPVVIDVHVDPSSGRVLEEGTGPLDELFMEVREPRSHRNVLAVGAVIPHIAREEDAGHRSNDAGWRRGIEEGLQFSGVPE